MFSFRLQKRIDYENYLPTYSVALRHQSTSREDSNDNNNQNNDNNNDNNANSNDNDQNDQT